MKESESLRLSKEVKNSFDVDEHFSCVSLWNISIHFSFLPLKNEYTLKENIISTSWRRFTEINYHVYDCTNIFFRWNFQKVILNFHVDFVTFHATFERYLSCRLSSNNHVFKLHFMKYCVKSNLNIKLGTAINILLKSIFYWPSNFHFYNIFAVSIWKMKECYV